MLRTFLNVRRSSLSQENYGQGKVTLRLRHAHHLILLLFKHLLHHRFSLAAQLMPSLATCYYWAPDIIGKCGIEVLLHDKEGYTEALQLYKQLYLHTHKLREEFFLEMVFFLASHGNLEEAFEVLQSVINQDPYRTNPLCRGYCGLLAYLMWRKEKEREQPASQTQDQLVSQYARVADQQWREMVQLLPGTVGVMDSFIHKYWQLLMELGREEESLDLLLFYRDLCPQHINSHRYLLCHINTIAASPGEETTGPLPRASDSSLRVDCWRKLTELDPSCDEVLELVQHCLQQGDPEYQELFHLLLHYLDYPHNGHRSDTGWELLESVMRNWAGFRTSPQWTNRLQWWRKLYPGRMDWEELLT